MFEIGATLREARTKRGLTAADVHRALRIRERYLSALEEERWQLLPGEAYAKGFLRTYAEFLGLDGRLYLDEYNARVSAHENAPFAPGPRRAGGRCRILVGAIAGALAACRAPRRTSG
jgi:cytoskeletal protein RodZ